MTERLVLAPIGLDDVDDFVVLYSDPLVALWTGPWTPATVATWAADMAERWVTEGVGKWTARDRGSNALVGRGGCTRLDLNGEQVLELGWALRDNCTGRGLATELGRAALDWAARYHPDLPVVAFTEVHNRASRAVMERLGMQQVDTLRRAGLMGGAPGSTQTLPSRSTGSEPARTYVVDDPESRCSHRRTQRVSNRRLPGRFVLARPWSGREVRARTRAVVPRSTTLRHVESSRRSWSRGRYPEMDWSWVDTVVGAGVGIAAYATGQARGRRQRSRDPYADDPKPVCGCGHHFSLHSDDGTCGGVTREIQQASTRGTTWVNQSCGCARYTGPEPLPRYLP